MLRRTTTASLRSLPTRSYSTPTKSAAANVLRSASATAGANRPPPIPSASAEERSLPSQPFIPKARSRAWQISSLSTPTDARTSTLISLQRGSETHQLQLPNLWLRDGSTHPAHRHPSSGQKLFKTSDLPTEGKVVGFGVHDVAGEEALVMEWSTPIKHLPTANAKLTVIPISALVKWLDKDKSSGFQGGQLISPAAEPWSQAALTYLLKPVNYSQYKSDDRALSSTLTDLLRDGLVMFKGVPTAKKEGTEEPELRALVERMSSVRRSWYGDLWDVKAAKDSLNIAYTNLELGLHMDLTHFEFPPQYQFLHCLSNKATIGGQSTFVDSFQIANLLRHAEPSAFHTLCTEPIAFAYSSPTHNTGFTRPTIELTDPSNPETSPIWAVNYSPPFQGPLPLTQFTRSTELTASHDDDRLSHLQDALQKWAALCEEPRNRFELQLEEGDCVAFDNRRILHARTAFTMGAGGERWLKGAYCNGDEVRSKWRVLEHKKRAGQI